MTEKTAYDFGKSWDTVRFKAKFTALTLLPVLLIALIVHPRMFSQLTRGDDLKALESRSILYRVSAARDIAGYEPPDADLMLRILETQPPRVKVALVDALVERRPGPLPILGPSLLKLSKSKNLQERMAAYRGLLVLAPAEDALPCLQGALKNDPAARAELLAWLSAFEETPAGLKPALEEAAKLVAESEALARK